MTPVNVSAPIFTLSVKANERIISEETRNKISQSRKNNLTYDLQLLNNGNFRVTERFMLLNQMDKHGLNYSLMGEIPVLIVTNEELAVSLKTSENAKSKSRLFTSNVLQNILLESGLISLDPVEYTVKRGKKQGQKEIGVQPVNFKLEKQEIQGLQDGIVTVYTISLDANITDDSENEESEAETPEAETQFESEN